MYSALCQMLVMELKRYKDKKSPCLKDSESNEKKQMKKGKNTLKFNMRLIYGLTKSRSLKGFINS